jgi:hypothetical protein
MPPELTPEASPAEGVRSTPRFQLAAGSAILVLLGSLGPWQKTLFGITANGLEVGAIVLVPALLLAGYALHRYDGGVEEHRKSVGWLLVSAALLVMVLELGNAGHVGGLVVTGWGAVVAGVGAVGLLAAGITTLRAPTLVP